MRLARARLPVCEHTPALVKRSNAGKGAADKKQMALVITAVLRLAKAPRSDAADALAVALTQMHAAGFQAAVTASRAGSGR